MTALFRNTAPKALLSLMADFGFSRDDAAAVMGNAGHESGGLLKLQEISPTVKGSAGGWGWFQWTGPRRRAFEAWAKVNMLDPAGYAANYGFLAQELKGPEKAAVAATKKAVGLMAKVKAFEMSFERAGVKHYDSRLKYAQMALEAYDKHIDTVAPPKAAPIIVPAGWTVTDVDGKPVPPLVKLPESPDRVGWVGMLIAFLTSIFKRKP